MDCSNGISGDSLRVMIVRASSIETVVRTGGGSSGSPHPSSAGSCRYGSYRPSVLDAEPRPFLAVGAASEKSAGDSGSRDSAIAHFLSRSHLLESRHRWQ